VGRRCPSWRQNSRVSTTNKGLQVSTNIVDIKLQHVYDVTLEDCATEFYKRPFSSSMFLLRRNKVNEGVRRSRYIDYIFFTSALAGGKWSASLPGRFTPGERAPAPIG
jgi:hypothetical protein